MQPITQLVNEDKLYSVVGKFFTDGGNLLLELIQNARRAKAKNVTIDIPYQGEHPFGASVRSEYLLRIMDDGRGIRDIRALLGIATSDWDNDIAMQDPAGMGFLQLLALSEQVHITSRFGSLHLDSRKFLGSVDYRRLAIAEIDTTTILEKGTVISAQMQKPWFSYIRSDMKWYSGFNTLKVMINGERVVPVNVKAMVKSAEEHSNLYRVLNHNGNTLFIEIGPASTLVGSSHSAVNWYGQLIPLYLSSGAASSYHIRFYYEVTCGTPLTPRYPDRTAINNDDKYAEFMAYVNRNILAMLREYFLGFSESARFSALTNAALLQTYYDNAPECDLEALDVAPMINDAYSGSSSRCEAIVSKAAMLKDGICFHEGPLQVDDTFNLAAEDDLPGCYDANENVAAVLRKAGVREVASVRMLNSGDDMVNIGKLMLEYKYSDGGIAVVPVGNALLMDGYGEVKIFADAEGSVHTIVHELLESVYDIESERSLGELQDDISAQLDDQLAAHFNIIDPGRFDFLPQYYDISRINFEFGNLAVDYKDGSSRNFAIRR